MMPIDWKNMANFYRWIQPSSVERGFFTTVEPWSQGGPYEAKVVACSNYDACYTSEVGCVGCWDMLINISLEYVNHCQSLTLDTDFFGEYGRIMEYVYSIATSNSLT